MTTLHEKILELVPEAQFVVWYTVDREQYMGEFEPVERQGCLVGWNPNNVSSCPSEEALEAIDEVALDAKLAAAAEVSRKARRDENAKSDLGILSGFRQEKKDNPNITLSQYLDELEQL